MKSFHLIIVGLVSMLGIANMAGAQDRELSKSEKAAKDVATQIAREFANRSGTQKDPAALVRTPLNLVFLVDTSQFNTKEAYVAFTKSFILRFGKDFGFPQGRAKVPLEQRHRLFFFPYQLKLIKDGPHVTRSESLTSDNLSKLIAKMPGTSLAEPGYKGRGHDSSGARRELLDYINANPKNRQTVVIQMTAMGINQDPDNPGNDQRIRAVNAREGLLDGTDFVAYSDSSPYTTEAPGRGQRPFDVYIWTYGPVKFVPGRIPPPPPPPDPNPTNGGNLPPEPQQKQSPNVLPIILLGIGIIGAGAGAGLLLRTRYRFQIAGSNTVFLTRGKSVKIETTSSKPSADGALLVPAAKVSTAGPGNIVATIELGWFASTPVLRAKRPFTLVIDGRTVSEASLKTETRVKFADNQQATFEVVLTTTKEK